MLPSDACLQDWIVEGSKVSDKMAFRGVAFKEEVAF